MIVIGKQVTERRERMIINIAHTKGGVGKSTIATNLAVEMKLPLLDLDMQRSSYFFNELRKEHLPGIEVYTVDTEEDLELLDQYAENSKSHIIVDSGGMDNNFNRLVLLMSDIIITPVGASQVELLGLDHFYEILAQANLDPAKEYVLLNSINFRSAKELKLLEEVIHKDFEKQLMKSIIGHRKLFKDAFAEGKSVVEKSKSSQASEEIQVLVKELKSILKKKAKGVK